MELIHFVCSIILNTIEKCSSIWNNDSLITCTKKDGFDHSD